MTNESRFMRELRLRQSRLNDRRQHSVLPHSFSASIDDDDEGELQVVNSKVMALCNEVDDDEDGCNASAATSQSRLRMLSQQSSRPNQRRQHMIQIVETRDEGDAGDFIEELAASISDEPSTLFCEKLARELDRQQQPSPQEDNATERDPLDELLDEALKDDDVESQDEESDPSSSSNSSSASCGQDDEEDAESLSSSIGSDDLRLIMTESGVSTTSYPVSSFYGYPGDRQSRSSVNGDINVKITCSSNDNTVNQRQRLHKKILISQAFHAAAAKKDDTSEQDSQSQRNQNDNDDDGDDDDDDHSFEYEYFPEPTVVDMLPGLNAALDALAERFAFGPCAKEDSVLKETNDLKYHCSSANNEAEEIAQDAQPAENVAVA
ncbi:hypothetical protein MPSEU_000975600 [Mayamaea pseudoterrestris]|nr:hypothetical protein MPSEU_000975600 [Mayamaea pseudoterrestris]